MNALRVLIIADNLLARAGLAALLTDHPDFYVVGQIATGDALQDEDLTQIEDYSPEVILVDLGWNAAAPHESLIKLASSTLPVVILLPHEEYVASVVATLDSSGAYGVLLNDTEQDTLFATLQAVATDLVVFDPLLATVILPDNESTPNVEPPTEALTPREIEVLQLLAEGLANKTIAQRLNISDHTVKFHVNAIMTKLSAQSRTEAVVRATRLGLIIL